MGGASMAPADVPTVMKPTPTERWRAGNHSAIALTPAGIAAASVRPRKPRKAASAIQPPASTWAQLAIDHSMANSAKPVRSPSVSSTKPQTGCITV